MSSPSKDPGVPWLWAMLAAGPVVGFLLAVLLGTVKLILRFLGKALN